MATYRLPWLYPTYVGNAQAIPVGDDGYIACIDDWPDPNYDTDYIKPPDDHYTTINLAFKPDISVLPPGVPINTVTVSALVKNLHTISHAHIQLWARNDQTTSGGLSPQNDVYWYEDWTWRSYTWALMPINNIPWTQDLLSRFSFGFWAWDTGSGTFERIRCTMCYVMADVTLPAPLHIPNAVPLLS